MKKKILSLILTFAMLASLSIVPLTAANAATGADIKLGQYLQLGTYYGNPILWRCVGFEKITGNDANGNPITDATDTKTAYEQGYLPLILCDKIISFKAFDAQITANDSTGSHSRGVRTFSGYNSNYWGDSTLRSWLNSDASAGNVTWLCGNPPTADKIFLNIAYDQEAGFLTNFTQNERSVIKTVNQKSILTKYDESLKTTGTAGLTRPDSSSTGTIDNWIQNYSTAYAEYVTDTMFCLDIKQFQNVYKNSNILGNEYHAAKPTEESFTAVGVDPYNNSVGMYPDSEGNYWLRTPLYSGSSEVYLCNYTQVGVNSGHHGMTGVRPAFFLDPTATLYGNGGENNPYSITAPAITAAPTAAPPTQPTADPTIQPTADPTTQPTADPTTQPTADPTILPTADPIATSVPVPSYPYVISDLSLKATDGSSLAKAPTNTGFMVNTKFTKLQKRDTSDYIFAAVYDKKGALLSLDYVQANFAENFTYDIGFYVPPQKEEIGTIKTFVWSSFDNMTPLAQSKELK